MDDPGELTLARIATDMELLVRVKGWDGGASKRPQTPRNLATSIVLEASELLECFQWSDTADDKSHLAEELADILLYACRLATVAGIDLDRAVREKLRLNMHRSWDQDLTPALTVHLP